MGVSPVGGGDVEGGVTVGGDLSIPPPEHSHTFHFNQSHYIPVYGGREASWVTGGQAVVGSGRLGIWGDADGGSEGGIGWGGGVTDGTAAETDK